MIFCGYRCQVVTVFVFLYLFTFCCCFHSAVGQGAHTSICFPGDDCNEFHEFDRRAKGEPIFFRDAGGCYKLSMKVKPHSEV